MFVKEVFIHFQLKNKFYSLFFTCKQATINKAAVGVGITTNVNDATKKNELEIYINRCIHDAYLSAKCR